MHFGHGRRVAESLAVQLGMIQRYQNPVVFERGGRLRRRFGDGQRSPSKTVPRPMRDERLKRNPNQQARHSGSRPDQREPDDGAVGGRAEQLTQAIGQQPDVERQDQHGRGPREPLHPEFVGECAHAAAVAGEMNQGNDGERQLHAQNHLAEDEQLVGALVARNVNDEGGGNDGDRARDEAAQPRAHADVQEAFHHDLAGQIVMEGFLNIRMRPWLRRLITRTIAIIPAALVVYISGDKGTYQLLILSQVILSMQLPFAVIPLIHFTSDRRRMGAFANKLWVQWLSWAAAVLILALNIWLLADGLGQLLGSAANRPIVWFPLVLAGTGVAGLLVWISFEPLIAHWARHGFGRASLTIPEPAAEPPVALEYHRILVPLDHTELDRKALSHAAAMAKMHGAKLYLLHVEEGVTSRIYGPLSSTAEVEAGEQYLERIAESLRAGGIDVETAIVHAPRPGSQIVRYALEIQPDLIIMGAHGHRRLKDLIFGNTINPVRHELRVPLLIVRK